MLHSLSDCPSGRNEPMAMVRAEALLRADTTSLCIISRGILRVQAASLSRCGQQSETCCVRHRAMSGAGWQRSQLLVTTARP